MLESCNDLKERHLFSRGAITICDYYEIDAMVDALLNNFVENKSYLDQSGLLVYLWAVARLNKKTDCRVIREIIRHLKDDEAISLTTVGMVLQIVKKIPFHKEFFDLNETVVKGLEERT